MVVHSGGKTVYGATIGILMLETRFPRITGDVAHAQSWDFPVQYRVVSGATPDNMVRQDPRARLDDFIREGRALVEMGCDGIATTCGFLTLMQQDLMAAIGVPVAASSLMQVPMVQATLPPGKRVGILTISKPDLTREHLSAANIEWDIPVVGTEKGREFTRAILRDAPRMDYGLARQDHLEAAAQLVQEYQNIGAIVLECTNMVPFAADIRKLTGLPVYSINSFVSWFHAGLSPRRFPMELDDPRLDLATYSKG